METLENLIETPKAIPFIIYSPTEGFSLTKESEDFLNTLGKERKIGVVSIVGKYRTGKSFFVNRVLLNKQKQGFKVGSTVNACTKGLWLWTQPLKSENDENIDMDILVIDTEGFGGIDENNNHDNKIFIFSLLLSSYFIFNSVGHIDENALNNLSLIINLAKDIQVKAHNSQQGDEIVNSFPAFLWVVRDFALKLVDKEGNSIKPKDYLEQALELQKGMSDSAESKNRIRRMFKHFFKERDCVTLIRPCEKEADLQKIDQVPDENLRGEFLNQAKLARQKILKKTKAKTIRNKQLNASMLIDLSRAYIEAINQGGVPNIDNAWKYIVKNESYKNLKESLQSIEYELKQYNDNNFIEFNDEKLKELKHMLLDKIIKNFQKHSLGDEIDLKEYYNLLKKEFKEKFNKFKEKNTENIKKKYLEYSRSILDSIEHDIKNDVFSNFYEFQLKFNEYQIDFEKNFEICSIKSEFILEISSKIYKIAAEYLTKRSEFLRDNELKLLHAKNLILEEDLCQKKKEYEQEKANTIFKLDQTIKEKEIMDINLKSTSDKLKMISEEKKILLLKFESLQAKTKGNENEFKFKYEELKNELENKFNDIREENIHVQNENDKKIALLAQENQFLNKENERSRKDSEEKNNEISNLKLDLETSCYENENLKKDLNEIEIRKQKELYCLKNEFEKKIKELSEQNQEKSKNKDKFQGEHTDFLIEKTYLENQIKLLNDQLQENKKMYDALYLALQQNLKTQEGDSDELLETNKYLTTAVDKMNIRCKAQEEKLTKLKVYKQFYNNSSGFKCLLCSKLISNHLFLKHISKCAEIIKTNNNSINLSKSNHSFSNIDSHKKNQVDYKNSLIKQNAKKHQSIHYDNEFNQRLTHEVSIEELREIQIELDQYINHDQKSSSEFLLSCFYHDFEWKIKKKYINFCELYQQISLAFPGLQLPDSCNIFNNQQIVNYEGDNILNEKKFALQNFIQDLSKIDFIRNSNYFRNFLEVQENLINYLKKEKNGALKNFQNFHGTKNSHFNSESGFVDSIDLHQSSKFIESMQKEKNQRSFNFFLDKSIELITDFTSSIPIDGVLAHKDIINSASSQIKNDSSYLNINKKHLPISPKTYLKKWESEVKKKTNHHRRISEISGADTQREEKIVFDDKYRRQTTDYSYLDTLQIEFSKENAMISQRVRTKAKNISGSFKTPLTSKKNSYLFKNQSKSKTTMQMMKNIVTYVKGI